MSFINTLISDFEEKTKEIFEEDESISLQYFALIIQERMNEYSGCPFFDRCPQQMKKCKANIPKLIEVEPNHWVACHLLS